MGFVDRGGGREAKGTSLRRSKKNPGAPSTKNKSANKKYVTPATRQVPTPPPACIPLLHVLQQFLMKAAAEKTDSSQDKKEEAVFSRCGLLSLVQDALREEEQLRGEEAAKNVHMDAAVALLSRKLEDDREGIARRAVEEGHLAGMLCWCAEIERQSALLDHCDQHNRLHREAYQNQQKQQQLQKGGAKKDKKVRFHDPLEGCVSAKRGTGESAAALLYCVLGVHVNSIDRVNQKLHEQWVKDLETNIKHGDVLGVLTGLNLGRDTATHYAQERLFRECWRVAGEAKLPLVLHLDGVDEESEGRDATLDKAVELLEELMDEKNAVPSPRAVVMYGGLKALAASPTLQKMVRSHPPQAGPSTTPPFYVVATADGLSTLPAEDGKADVSLNSVSSALLPPLTAFTAGQGKESSSVIAPSQLLMGTGAPWGTPDTLPDPHLRTLPNEPGNFHYVCDAVAHVMQQNAEQPKQEKETAVEAFALTCLMNFCSLFFQEWIHHADGDDDDSKEDHEKDEEEEEGDEEEEESVAASHVAPVVAGLTDEKEKTEMERLLAEAAAERDRVERERAQEEEAMMNRRTLDAQEKKEKREKKKNVKANNRSNFTHFRNKDFAPRQSKQDKLAHQLEVEGFAQSDSDDENENVPQKEASSGSDGEEEQDRQEVPQMQTHNNRRNKKKNRGQHRDEDGEDDEGPLTKRELQQQKELQRLARELGASDDDEGHKMNKEDNSSDDEDADTMMSRGGASRKQRRKQQKRQQQK